MKGYVSFSSDHAVSEVVGGMILVVIAVLSFAIIYFYLFPHFEPVDKNIKILGYVTDDGTAVLQHDGGTGISNYRIDVRTLNGTLLGSKTYHSEPPWTISECRYPLEDIGYGRLLNENDKVQITIYNLNDDGSEYTIFDGPLQGKTKGPTPAQPTSLPMLVSSLRTNTIDEDLICYNYSIKPNINALTYIYNWIANGGSITDILMPFDTNSPVTVKDYSGNKNNGTASGPSWVSSGVVGGAYQFDGVNDYISLPYCFKSNFIDAITIEAWIKPTSPSGIISSYNRNKYWELGVLNGKIQWSTTATDGTKDTTSSSTVNDGNWHHVAATYDSFNGESAIYIDGKQDIKKSEHTPEELLGTGDTPQGWIGTGPEAARTTVFSTSFETQDEKNNWKPDNETWGGGGQTETWIPLKYDNFESGWGSYTSGGSDASLRNDYKHEGSWSARIRHSSGASPPASSFYLTNGIDVDTPGYTSLKIDFWWMWRGSGWTDSSDDWWLRYFNGTTWQTVLDIDYPSGFSKDTWYHQIFYINESNYNFPNSMKIRFQCDARDDNCMVYIDQVYINATAGSRTEYNFDLRNSSALTPRTGSYSIGGTGDFDPEYAYFNRTGIDISGHKNVTLSVYYSYKGTNSTDKLGLYYKDGANWVTIFNVTNPQTNGSQLPWVNVQVQIPDYIDDLVLQFRWITSATSKYVAIDDLEITGVPLGGGYNFSGLIDEFRIYNRALSAEQIYQNYLCTKNGYSDKSIIVSEEINLGNIWKCIVTPNNIMGCDTPVESNTLQIVGYSGGD